MTQTNKQYTTTVTGRLITNPARFFNASEDEGLYDALVVLDDGQAKKINALRDEFINDTFNGKVPAGLKDYTVQEGDDPEYESSYEHEFIFPKSKPTRKGPATKPRVVKKVNGQFEQVEQEEGLFYSGCYVAVNINLYGSKAQKEAKIPAYMTLGLKGVMFLRDGEPLGETFNEDSAFGDMGDSEVKTPDEF